VAAWEVIRSIRVFPFFDINAGASTCVLIAVPAVWVAVKRPWWPQWVLAPVAAFAVWLAGSRAALAGAVVGLAAAALMSSQRRLPKGLLAAGLVATLAIAWFATLNPGREQIAANEAMSVRAEMTRVGLRLAAEQPVFGVGLGRFKALSVTRMSPEIVARHPALGAGENAHNNFVQILAELGGLGLIATLWLLGVVAVDVLRAVRARAASPELVGMACGLLAFLISCLSGHPLLVIPVVFVFFLAAGLTAGLTPAQEPGAHAAPPFHAWAAGAIILVLVATLPVRLGW
jgi:O-antigen ligase